MNDFNPIRFLDCCGNADINDLRLETPKNTMSYRSYWPEVFYNIELEPYITFDDHYFHYGEGVKKHFLNPKNGRTSVTKPHARKLGESINQEILDAIAGECFDWVRRNCRNGHNPIDDILKRCREEGWVLSEAGLRDLNCANGIEENHRAAVELMILLLLSLFQSDQYENLVSEKVQRYISQRIWGTAENGPPTSDSEQQPSPRPLKEYLDTLLRRTRNNHPSFVLLKKDEIARRLFPGVAESEQFEALGKISDNGPVSPVWNIIRDSWKNNKKRNIVIEGTGGIGKTVTLFSVTNIADDTIPPAVYVPMHRLVNEDGNCVGLSEYLEGLSKIHGQEILALANGGWTNGPKLLILLDGFNEVPPDKRRKILHMINDWNDCSGAQLIAVSRPMDGLNLGRELTDDPLTITLEPLDRNIVKEYLGDRAPVESSPLWDVLVRPLFLNLYRKTVDLEGRTSNGYSLTPKKAENGASLIWNYLQRELLREDSESWVLRCAFVCECILPYIAFVMEKDHRFTIERKQAVKLISDAVDTIDLEKLPHHLTDLVNEYESRHFDSPDLASINWKQTTLLELGLLKQVDKTSYSFIHQIFRDALAGLYLVNQAESAPDETLPEVWRTSHSPELMDYAAELMEEETVQALWSCVRAQNPIDRRCFYVQMELNRRRGADGLSRLDFSGMNLRGISLAKYGNGLFQNPDHTIHTEVNPSTFQVVGHHGGVTCVTVLEDGRLVSGSWDHTLRIWDPNTGDCLNLLEGHTGPVFCVTALKDGRIVSGSDDHTLRVWNLQTGECQVLEGHTLPVLCVTALKDGRIVSGSWDKTLRVWNLQTGECQVLEGHTDRVFCVTELKDGRIVSGSDDKTLRVWNLQTGESQVLEGHDLAVSCVTQLEDGRIVSGSGDNTLRVWNLQTGESQVLQGHNGGVTCVTVLEDGRIVSGAHCTTLQLWNLQTRESQVLEAGKFQNLVRHTDWVLCLTTLKDGRIVSGSEDNTLLIWSLNSNAPHRQLGIQLPHVSTVSTAPGGGHWITGHDDGTVRIWDGPRKQLLRILREDFARINYVTALNDGWIVSLSKDSALRVWNSGAKESQELEWHTFGVGYVTTLKDGRIVSGSYANNTLYVWNLQTGESQVLQGHTSGICCLTTLKDGRIVSGSSDETLRVWNLRTGDSQTLKGHTHEVIFVMALNDGRIVSGSFDDTLRVWNLQTGESQVLGRTKYFRCGTVLNDSWIVVVSRYNHTFRVWNLQTGENKVMKGHTDDVFCVTVLTDGRIISGAFDNTIRVWNLQTEKSRILEGHSDIVSCVIPLDDKHILSGSDDCTLRIWDVDSGKCISVIPISEMNVIGMDLRNAVMDQETARLLYCNGAKVPEELIPEDLIEE